MQHRLDSARATWLAVTFPVLFAVAMYLGQMTSGPASPLALAWPAAGVSMLWMTWAWQRHVLPLHVLLLVAVCTGVNVDHGIVLWASAAFGGVNLAHGLLAAWVLRRFRGPHAIDAVLDLRAAWVVAFASLAGGVASSVAGGVVAHLAFDEGFLDGFTLIVARNALTCFVVGIALMGAPAAWRTLLGSTWQALALCGAVLVATALIFRINVPIAFTIIPLSVIVGSVRRPEATAMVTFLQGGIVVAITASGTGPFSLVEGTHLRAILALGLVAVMTAVSLALSTSNLARSEALVTSQRAQQRLRDFMDASQIASAHVAATLTTRTLSDHNQALGDLLGDLPPGLGHDPINWFTLDDQPRLRQEWATLLRDAAPGAHSGWRGRLQLHDDAGSRHVDVTVSVVRINDEHGTRSGDLKIQLIDITAQHQAEAQLAYAAHHDSLTGLGNRVLFHESLGTAIADVSTARDLALFYIDVDHFKTINDTHGHIVGDTVLIEIAHRLKANTRATDLVARIGGDEFVIVAPNLDPTSATVLAQRLVEEVARPIETSTGLITATASVGLAHTTTVAPGLESMMQAADNALYDAKTAGRARHAVHGTTTDPGDRPDLIKPQWSQLRVHYQLINDHTATTTAVPVTDGAAGASEPSAVPSAVEALIRWDHPTQGTLEPAAFLHHLDSAVAMRDLACFVLAQALTDLDDLLDNPTPIDLHINVSAIELADPGFGPRVIRTLNRHQLPAHRLVLEITESHALDISATIATTMATLHNAGVRFAVDDFGTGYNALSHLLTLPIDIIKLDRAFVATLPDDGRGKAIADGVKLMADHLGITLIAEGVEDANQLATLHHLGYQRTQGFYSDHPRPWADVLAELQPA